VFGRKSDARDLECAVGKLAVARSALKRGGSPDVDRTGVTFDVGANIGCLTKVLGEATDFRGTVHLFEPIPNLAELCHETLLDAPFETYVHEFGLSDEDTSVDIFIATILCEIG